MPGTISLTVQEPDLERSVRHPSRVRLFVDNSCDGRTHGGIFRSTDLVEQLDILSTYLFESDAISVSVEPLGGGLQPTGAIVLLGNS